MKRFNLHFSLRFSFSYLVLNLLLIGPISLNAQIYTGNLTLSSQADVDAFSYTEVTGALVISGPDINNLNGLSSLTSVGNVLSIFSNPTLTNIGGMSNLTVAGGGLIIALNPALPNLNSLSALTTVGKLEILKNGALTNLDGLSSLTSVDWELFINGNDAMTNLDGLSALTTVGGNLRIVSADALPNLDGLSSLTSVGGKLDIFFNNALTNIDGLSAITSVGGMLFISDNISLTNLDGLSALTSVGGNLRIRFNDGLTNLDGLSALTSLGGELEIFNNTILLGFCGLYSLFNSGWEGNYYIGGNLYNPTKIDIITGGSCTLDPVQLIADLLANSTLNKGQANALKAKLNNCNLNTLNNQLNAFVNAGILTQVEADDLSLAANQTCNPPARMVLPQTFVLGRSYPNPAKTYTMIPFTLSTDENIKIDLYDASGKEVRKVLNKPFFKGKHEVKVDLRSLPSGTYFYKLKAGEQIEMLPIVVE